MMQLNNVDLLLFCSTPCMQLVQQAAPEWNPQWTHHLRGRPGQFCQCSDTCSGMDLGEPRDPSGQEQEQTMWVRHPCSQVCKDTRKLESAICTQSRNLNARYGIAGCFSSSIRLRCRPYMCTSTDMLRQPMLASMWQTESRSR